MRSASLTSFEGADAVDRETSDGGEFFLRVACRFAKCLELRTK
jgi:hypothetical protein